ncbi:unnamed protein product, partial [Didymodactylos carnosus]
TPSSTSSPKTHQQAQSQQQSPKTDQSSSSTPLKSSSSTSTGKDDDEASVADEDDFVFDEEEFETSESELFGNNVQSSNQQSSDFKITDVPLNLTGNRWEAYRFEALMIIALLGYLINFLIGRTKNSRLATVFYQTQRDLLEKNFACVGDNGQTKDLNKTTIDNPDEQGNNNFVKESENLYLLWCSGRIYLESMLVELRFVKRQCLFNLMASVMKSVNDTVVYTIDYAREDIDTFVFCLARKRCAAKLHKDMFHKLVIERKYKEE